MFEIVDEFQNRLQYIGMIVKRGEEPIAEEYQTLLPGASVSAVVDLADNYEFKTVGKHVVRVDLPLNSQLMYAPDDSQLASFLVDDVPAPPKRDTAPAYTNCNSNQISQCESSVTSSRSECSRSVNCLNSGCDTPYARWFGTYTATNWNFVSTCFRNVYNRLTNYAFNGYCNPAGCGSNVYGYVYPTDTTYTVYLCGLFWSRPNERVNTVVHEMSHFRALAGTNDYAYGQSACLNLARSNPTQASHNADNICYFAGEM